MKMSLLRPLIALGMCLGLIIYFASHTKFSALPRVTGSAGAENPVSSETRLVQLDETFGTRHPTKATPWLGLPGDMTIYAYDSVPAPLRSVRVMLDGASLAAVKYEFGGTGSNEQLEAAFKANGKGWKNQNLAIAIAGNMGNWASEEGHWLERFGPTLTIYFDGRVQAMKAAAEERQTQQNKSPKL